MILFSEILHKCDTNHAVMLITQTNQLDRFKTPLNRLRNFNLTVMLTLLKFQFKVLHEKQTNKLCGAKQTVDLIESSQQFG